MKIFWLRLVGFVVTVAIVVGASRLWAENKGKKPAPRTRIGLFNLAYVVKNYDKYNQFQEETKVIIEPFQKRDAKLRARLEQLREQWPTSKQASTHLTPPPQLSMPSYLTPLKTKKKSTKDSPIQRATAEEVDEDRKPEDLEEEAKKIQRALEENSMEAKRKLGKRSEEELRVLFLDVYAAAQRYASTHDLDLVMHYNDAITKEDYFSTQNIARKLQNGALVPIYSSMGIDITQELAESLNRRLNKK